MENPKSLNGLNCPRCVGTGQINKPLKTPGGAVNARVTCPDCKGTGRSQHRDERV